MGSMKILTVIGARPQFIKASALSRVVASTPGVSEILLHTGQHYDRNMSAVFFESLAIPSPKYHLQTGGGTHAEMTGKQLVGIEAALEEERPDVCVVYGDTNSTLAGALAAAKLRIPVAHVEAGLRSFNRRMPEEVNRVLTDHASDALFSPSRTAVLNLEKEGIATDRIHYVGDVMFDVNLWVRETLDIGIEVGRFGLETKTFILATIHRQETVDDIKSLREILWSLADLSQTFRIVVPLHPRTKRIAGGDAICGSLLSKLLVIEPVDFRSMVALTTGALLVVTDSGGLQKEAYFAGVPCVTVRSETEWVELVEIGWNRVPVHLDRAGILEACNSQISANPSGTPSTNPYGDGDAAQKILKVLLSSYARGGVTAAGVEAHDVSAAQ
jgi:UDP-GlcNAc3NAcA epimerase